MRFTFNFPDLGEGLEEGTILQWFVSEGDSVKLGDPVVQMETDKVVADIPSPKSGIIAVRYGNVGDVIHVGLPLVEIKMEEHEGESESMLENSNTGKQIVPENEIRVRGISESEDGAAVVGTMELAGEGAFLAASDEGVPETKKSDGEGRKVLATPVARAMAKEMGIDINGVTGSGPSGRVKKEDILKFKSPSIEIGDGRAVASNDLGVEEDVTYRPLTQIRKTIARNMLHAKHNAVHMSIFEEVEISVLKQVVTKYKPKFADKDVKLTYLSFVVKAVAYALKQYPQFNSRIDTENNRMVFRNRYHIGIAVDAPDGLVVPVIRDADRLSIFRIARRIGELAAKARERKLALNDMKEGSFTITSFGSIGGVYATPVLNYPQAGILGIGRILKAPIVKGDEIVIGNIMPLSLTVDHRVVDGGETARFINGVKEYLSDPVLFLMGEE